jgi:hypothetical protein
MNRLEIICNANFPVNTSSALWAVTAWKISENGNKSLWVLQTELPYGNRDSVIDANGDYDGCWAICERTENHDREDDFNYIIEERGRIWDVMRFLFVNDHIKTIPADMVENARYWAARSCFFEEGYNVHDDMWSNLGCVDRRPISKEPSEKDILIFGAFQEYMKRTLDEKEIIAILKGNLILNALRKYESDTSSLDAMWIGCVELTGEKIREAEKAKKIAEAKAQIAVLASMIAELEA